MSDGQGDVVVLDETYVQSCVSPELDIRAFKATVGQHCGKERGCLPARSSRHFSCNLPFFGIANKRRPSRASTSESSSTTCWSES